MSNSTNKRTRWTWKVVGIGLLGIASFYGTRALYLRADDQYPSNNQNLLGFVPPNQATLAPNSTIQPPAFPGPIQGFTTGPAQPQLTYAPTISKQNPLTTLANVQYVPQSRSTSHQVQQLVKEIQQAERQDPEKATNLKGQLAEKLEQEFNQKHEQHQKQIAALEKQLEQARQLYDKREKNKTEIISRRTSQLLGQADDLAWDLPSNPSRAPRGNFTPFSPAGSSQPMPSWTADPSNLPVNHPPTFAPAQPPRSAYPSALPPQQTPLTPGGSNSIPARQPGYPPNSALPTRPAAPQANPELPVLLDSEPVQPLGPSTPPSVPDARPDPVLPPQSRPSQNARPPQINQAAPLPNSLPDVQAPVAPNVDESVLSLTLLSEEKIRVHLLPKGQGPDNQVTSQTVARSDLDSVLSQHNSVDVLKIHAPEEMEFSEVQKLMRVGLRLKPNRILFQSIKKHEGTQQSLDLPPENADQPNDLTQLPNVDNDRQLSPAVDATEPPPVSLMQDREFTEVLDNFETPLAEPEPSTGKTDTFTDTDES